MMSTTGAYAEFDGWGEEQGIREFVTQTLDVPATFNNPGGHTCSQGAAFPLLGDTSCTRRP